MMPFVSGAVMLYQIAAADIRESYAASREQLGIPESKQEQVLDEYQLGSIHAIKYDTNGDGKPDMVEYYFSGHKHPFMLWLDKNRNGNPDPGESYASPKENEDWITGMPRKGLDI